MLQRLKGMRTMVVGASSGIGRALAVRAAEEGAIVAAASRRVDLLEALVAELPGEAVAVECDVVDEASCERAVAKAVERLGGLDALVYATGYTIPIGVRDADQSLWRRVLDTNVIGASLVTRAAIGHLEDSSGRALYVSSIAADDRPPRPGLGIYITAKSALNTLIRVWQEEHRRVSFTRVSVGDTGSTDMASEWDPAVTQSYVQDWIAKGYLFGRTMTPESVARHLVDLLASDERVDVSRILPRYSHP